MMTMNDHAIMLTFYILLLVVIGVVILFIPFKPNPRRQGVGFIIMGVVSFVRAWRFHTGFRHGAWFWVAYGMLATLYGLYVLIKNRNKPDATPPQSPP